MTQAASQVQTNGNTPPPITSTPGKSLTLREAVAEVNGQLAAQREQYAVSLPKHIPPERFQRTIVTACNLHPELMKADRRSLFNACSKAASDGLLPDGRDGALVIFNTKEGNGYVNKVQWMPMLAGIIKKARQSGEISSLGARLVYEKEIEQGKFTHKVIDGIPKVDHEPILWGERGKPVLVYSFVQFKDGSVDFEFLHADDVNKVRSVSRSKDKGPWASWTDEMWKKTAIRRHAKRLPISSELFDTIARDDEMTEFQNQRNEAERKMLTQAATQMGAASGDDSNIIDQTIEDGEHVLADEAALEAKAEDLLAGMESELKSLDACMTIVAVEALEKGIGMALAGDFDRLEAWSAACADKAASLRKKK